MSSYTKSILVNPPGLRRVPRAAHKRDAARDKGLIRAL